MQVSAFVKEAIDDAVLYSKLDYKSDVTSHFKGSEALGEFERALDVSFFNILNQTMGYYQLKRFAATCGEADKLSFVEDASEYRLLDDQALRLTRWVVQFRVRYLSNRKMRDILRGPRAVAGAKTKFADL